MNIHDEQYKRLILQAEIAALLHDIGKFTKEFLYSGMKQLKDDKGNVIEPDLAHTILFVKQAEENLKRLLFDTLLPDSWLFEPETKKQLLKAIGDFIRFHHSKKEDSLKNHYEVEDISVENLFLLPHILLMIADTTDSSSSKGPKETIKDSLQSSDFFYLATPFGDRQYSIHKKEEITSELPYSITWKEFEREVRKFQTELFDILYDILERDISLNLLIEKRNRLIEYLKKTTSNTVAETRLPTNDVTLWQHLYTTASIFKALMARHLLLKDYTAWIRKGENKIDMIYYKENLCYLGICWDEYELLKKSYRPSEIRGRIFLLKQAKEKIQKFFETELCIGNKFYEDRNGIYFLIPSFEENNEIADKIIDEIKNKVEIILNNKNTFHGDLNWQIWQRKIKINLLEFAYLVFKKGEDKRNTLLFSGSKRPLWILYWKDKKDSEICPHCGLRPVDNEIVTSGSEQDKICAICESYKKFGRFEESSKLYTKALTLEELVLEDTSDESSKRIALVSASFNLMPFLSGEAFSNIMLRNLDDFKEIDLNKLSSILKEYAYTNRNIKLLKKLFNDNSIGSLSDGRVPGENKAEKAKNFIEEIVLKAPFSKHLKDNVNKVINYAARLQPAPSRLVRIWETTEEFVKHPLYWCERERIPYIPLVIDSGSVMFLMRADERLWQCCLDIYNEYCNRFGRVRHLLPLHLSVIVFYYKSPLYVAIDAARRFRRLAMEEIGEKLWEVKEEVKREGENYILELKDHRQRDVTWKIPIFLPNGKEDRFYTWFWVEGISNFPVHIKDLKKGQKIYVYPSTFDYEVLDTTTRRYDIRLNNNGRPHLFCGEDGPRPYPLSIWEKWSNMEKVIQKVESSQRKHLIEQLAHIYATWNRQGEEEAKRGLCEDLIDVIFSDALKREKLVKKEDLLKMTMDGSIFDLIEWYEFICKKDKKQEGR